MSTSPPLALERSRATSHLRRAFVSAVLLCACGGGPREPVRASLPTSSRAASGTPLESIDFILPQVGALAPFRFSSLSGGPVLVQFFTVGCVVCELDYPFLQSLVVGEHAIAGLRVVGIGLDPKAAKLLPAFAEVHGLTYPMLAGDEPMLRGVTPFAPTPITTLPMTYLVDGLGRVVERFSGTLPVAYMRQRVMATR